MVDCCSSSSLVIFGLERHLVEFFLDPLDGVVQYVAAIQLR
jgi:hypothetical protein